MIAKLDRLSRNVAFIANLMEGRSPFVACDNPHANRLMLHMLAAFAEHEREPFSQRTRAALAAAKARGTRLGNPRIETAWKAAREAAEVRRPPPPFSLRSPNGEAAARHFARSGDGSMRSVSGPHVAGGGVSIRLADW